MIQLAPIGLTMFVLVAADQSGGALLTERVVGLHRVCAYEDRLNGRRAPSLQVVVGLAEPCPLQYPGRPRVRPAEIPAMATFERRTREGSQAVCHYIYLGARYSRPVPAGQTCPYTPIFN